MIVYHGSYLEVNNPQISFSRKNVDFGKGFYVTPIKEQAVNWSRRFKKNKGRGIVSAYEFDLEGAKKEASFMEFKEYSEDWLEYIMKCRKGQGKDEYDIIIGGVANDKVFNTIELYLENLINKDEAIKRLRYEKPNLQICICNQAVIEKYVKFVKSEEF